MVTNTPRRQRVIVKRLYYRHASMPSRSKDSVICTLDCGHLKRYKGSQEPKSIYVMCQECHDND